MTDPIDQQLDKLTKKIIKDSSLEQPSLDFTTQVMSKIEMTSEKVTAYQPLISKKGWFTITILFIAGILLAFSGNFTSGWFESVDLNVLSNNKLSETLSGFSFDISDTLMYAIVLFGLLFFVQISLMKKHHDKQLNY